MNKRKYTHRMDILLFSFLLSLAVVSYPLVSRFLDAKLAALRDSLLARITEITQYTIAYDSISPSIFRSVKISNFSIWEEGTNRLVARFENITITYRIIDIFLAKGLSSIEEITLSNGIVDLEESDLTRYTTLVEAKPGNGAENGAVPGSAAIPETPGFQVPDLSIALDNIALSYKAQTLDIACKVTQGTARSSAGILSYSLKAEVSAALPYAPSFPETRLTVEADGSSRESFRQGSSRVRIRRLENNLFAMKELGLAASWTHEGLNISTIQDLQPVDVQFSYAFDSGDISLDLECERLLPLRWIEFTASRSAFLDSLTNSEMSGKVTLSVSAAKGLQYGGDLSFLLSEAVYDGASAKLSFKGNNEGVSIARFDIEGKALSASMSGFIEYPSFMPTVTVNVARLTLPSGNTVSGEAFITNNGKSVELFIPSLSSDSARWTDFLLTIYPESDNARFALEAFDGEGKVGAEGTFSLRNDAFLEAYVAFDSVRMQTLIGTVTTPPAILEPFRLTTEVYVSTDFKDISYNCTRLVFASTRENGLFLLLSANGTNTNLDISDVLVSYSGRTLSGNLQSYFEKKGEFLFDSAFEIDSIPYDISGIYSDNTLTLYGSYGFSAMAHFGGSDGISGTFQTTDFPVPLSPSVLSLSINSAYEFYSVTDWNLAFYSISLEEITSYLPSSLVVRATGTLDNVALNCDSVAVTDQFSTISGTLAARFFQNDQFDTPGHSITLRLASADSRETLGIDATVSADSLQNLTAEIRAKAFPLGRVVKGQPSTSTVTAQASLTKTGTSLNGNLELTQSTYRLNDFDLNGYASIRLDDNLMSVERSGASWNGHVISNLRGSFDIDTLIANAQAEYAGVLGSSGITAVIDTRFEPVDAANLDRFTAQATVRDLKWKSLNIKEDVTVSIQREPGITAVYAGKNDMITGFLLDDGTFSLTADSSAPVSFVANGTVIGSSLSIDVEDVFMDFASVWSQIGLPAVSFKTATISGGFTVTGLLNDPDFTGELIASDVIVSSPFIFENTFGPVSFTAIASGKAVDIPRFTIPSKKGGLSVETRLEFDRWIPSYLRINAVSLPLEYLALNLKTPYINVAGRTSFNVTGVLDSDGLNVIGDTSFSNGNITMLLAGLSAQRTAQGSFRIPVKLELNFNLGQKVEFRWPSDEFPFITGLVIADKPVHLSLDTAAGTYQLKGEASIRGGEVLYLKRSFYVRQGSISFNENQDIFDPIVTLRAEIRERDQDGLPVRIVLYGANQPLSVFSPKLTSEPIKSELEILALLGQVASADSSRETILRDTVVTATDLLSQLSLYRGVEDAIRDALRLDLFSIRTLLLQNALLDATVNSETAAQGANRSIGNYFDNTTVYMGKYFGSAIYADALMHFSYFDPVFDADQQKTQAAFGQLLFQPELGFEIATPFFMMRWGITPSRPQALFIPDNSITLSWKFSY